MGPCVARVPFFQYDPSPRMDGVMGVGPTHFLDPNCAAESSMEDPHCELQRKKLGSSFLFWLYKEIFIEHLLICQMLWS